MPSSRRWPPWYNVVLLCTAAVFISYNDRTNISVASIQMKDQFGWNETMKGYVLSSFFVGYLAFMAISGALANRFGGKIVLGIAVLWWSAFTMLTPAAALISLPALLAARVALGAGEAAVFPASMNMVGRWVPIEHRSQAVALLTSGLSIGTMVSLPITGWLVRSYGWPMPFYAFGAVGIVWVLWWFAGVGSGRGTEVDAPAATRESPWKRLLSLPSVWALFVAHFCSNWSLYVLLAWLPTYFKTAFNVSLSDAGLLSAAPWLSYFIVANVGAYFADRMIRRGRSVTFVRKLMQVSALLGCSTFLLLLPQATTVAMGVFLMCGAGGTIALCLSAFAPNGFDIAPRYADVIWGISNTGGTVPGVVGVAITGWLIDRTGSFTAPFVLTAAISVFGAAFYLVYGSGEKKID
jgi:ACS family sodium-dependent inorganic phosphate cotransporter